MPVSQAQFDALVSFHYNTGAIAKASFVKKLNAGDTIGAAAGMMAWSKPAEIIPRRKAEQRLFAHGVYPTGQVTVWKVDGNGKVLDNGERRQLELKAGDKVIFGKYSGQTVKVDGEELLVMREEDVMGIVE